MTDPRIKRFGLAGFNKPKRTQSHPKKSHIVLAKEGDKIKLIRFGMQGAKNKPPRQGESEADKAKRKSFKDNSVPSSRIICRKASLGLLFFLLIK